MTVLVVPSWYKSGGQAQLGAFFREQALALNGRGVCAIVADATLQSRQSALHDQFRLRVLNDEGLLTYAYTTPSFGGWRLPRLGVRIYYSNLKKIMKHLNKDGKRIDVIHAHSYFPAGVAAVRLGKKLHIPVVITEHSGSIISGKLSKTQQTLLAECVEKADSFICVSEALGRQVIA